MESSIIVRSYRMVGCYDASQLLFVIARLRALTECHHEDVDSVPEVIAPAHRIGGYEYRLIHVCAYSDFRYLSHHPYHFIVYAVKLYVIAHTRCRSEQFAGYFLP